MRTARWSIDPPGDGYGFWAGGPSAVFHDGQYWLAYRLRRPVSEGRGYANVVARSVDGVRFETVATVTSAQFECASLERPALVPLPGGGWRLYVSCSTVNSKHWWVEAIEADTAGRAGRRTPHRRAGRRRRHGLEGRRRQPHRRARLADVGVPAPARRWRRRGRPHADLVRDQRRRPGLDVHRRPGAGPGSRPGDLGPARSPGGRAWPPIDGVWTMLYDGRADAAENWEERTALAVGHRTGALRAVPIAPIGGHLRAATGLRYASFLADPARRPTRLLRDRPLRTALTTCARSTCRGRFSDSQSE